MSRAAQLASNSASFARGFIYGRSLRAACLRSRASYKHDAFTMSFDMMDPINFRTMSLQLCVLLAFIAASCKALGPLDLLEAHLIGH